MPPLMCLGCSRPFVPRRPHAKPICYGCQRDEFKYRRALRKHKAIVQQAAIDRIAELETARLERKDTFTPLMGERLVEMMQRG